MLNSEVGSCPECGSSVELDSYRAETVCVGCSIVVERSLIEPTPSVKTDDNGIRQEYHSGPPSLPFGSKMTYIRVGRGATGKTLTGKQTHQGFRLEIGRDVENDPSFLHGSERDGTDDAGNAPAAPFPLEPSKLPPETS